MNVQTSQSTTLFLGPNIPRTIVIFAKQILYICVCVCQFLCGGISGSANIMPKSALLKLSLEGHSKI